MRSLEVPFRTLRPKPGTSARHVVEGSSAWGPWQTRCDSESSRKVLEVDSGAIAGPETLQQSAVLLHALMQCFPPGRYCEPGAHAPKDCEHLPQTRAVALGLAALQLPRFTDWEDWGSCSETTLQRREGPCGPSDEAQAAQKRLA